jgi:glycosyltransferase involved in cell wall biosynthesis
MEPFVSVLMTAYNREAYIAEAIESVLASTYTNFELIIVDDRSKDRTIEIARAYEKKDSRVKVYVNEVNLGDYQNRNKAAGYAKGKYLKYLDSDDIIYPHGLVTMVDAMEKFPEVGVGFSAYKGIDNSILPFLLTSLQAYEEHYFNGGLLYTGPTGAIYKRDFFEKIGNFDTQYGVATDCAFNLKAAQNAPIVILHRDLFWWRPHSGQESLLRNDLYGEYNYQINLYYLNHSSCPLTFTERSIALNNLKNIHCRKILNNTLRFRFEEARNEKRGKDIGIFDLFLALLPSALRRKIQ